MTANQIEYWKLRETQRHNVTTEEMDRPVKESQAKLNLEQVATYPTIRALNIAQEGAARASEAAGYATAAERYAAAELDYAKVGTEATQQGVNLAKQGYTDLETKLLGYSEPQAMANALKGKAQYDYLSFNTKGKNQYARLSLFNEAGGDSILSAGVNAAKTAYTIFAN